MIIPPRVGKLRHFYRLIYKDRDLTYDSTIIACFTKKQKRICDMGSFRYENQRSGAILTLVQRQGFLTQQMEIQASDLVQLFVSPPSDM